MVILSRESPSGGFTYVGVIVIMVIISISLAMAGRFWATVMKREREAELLFRGDQFVRAIEAYYYADNRQLFPDNIQDLLKDRRSPGVRRFLRRIYRDPITGKPDWVIIVDGSGKVIGLHSQSDGQPLKTGNFPELYQDFSNRKSYRQWRFVFNPEKKKALAASKAPGAAPPPTPGAPPPPGS